MSTKHGNMDVEMLSCLPMEIVERALSFLSAPDLCRFRSVCKRWNWLICQPEFGALCIRHAREDARFLVARCFVINNMYDDLEYGIKVQEWRILDVNARRWYTIRIPDSSDSENVTAVDMDGGLVCQFRTTLEDRNVSVFVSNPIAKTFRRLPTCPLLTTPVNAVNVVVDHFTQTYKIFVIHGYDYYTGNNDGDSLVSDPRLVVYDSTINQWCNAMNPPKGICGDTYCSVAFHGILYILMSFFQPHTYNSGKLWSYDPVEDAWNDTGVSMDLCLYIPQLLVSDNRLFVGSWIKELPGTLRQSKDEGWGMWSYELSEVFLEERTLSTVFRVTNEVMQNCFGTVRGAVIFSYGDFRCYPPFEIYAFESYKSIVLLRETSMVCRVYDLRKHSWDVLPKGPDDYDLFGAKSMNLILPTSTFWEREAKIGGEA